MDLLNLNINFSDPSLFDILPLEDEIQELLLEVGNEYSDLALAAFKAKVPVNTEELRNNIDKEIISADSLNVSAQIFIKEGFHQSSSYNMLEGHQTSQRLTLDEVAEDLDKFAYRRSHGAISDIARFTPPGAGTSTAGWQDEAMQDLEAAI